MSPNWSIMNKLIMYQMPSCAKKKQIKAGSGKKKIDLINEMNPDWNDLSIGLLPKITSPALTKTLW